MRFQVAFDIVVFSSVTSALSVGTLSHCTFASRAAPLSLIAHIKKYRDIISHIPPKITNNLLSTALRIY